MSALFDKEHREELKKKFSDMSNLDDELPNTINRYSIDQLSHMIITSFYQKQNGLHMQNTPAGKYLFENMFSIEAMKTLYDAAQYSVFGDRALSDLDYSLDPSRYVSCLEKDLFSVNNYGRWKDFTDSKNSKKHLDLMVNSVTTDGDGEKFVYRFMEFMADVVYAMATKNDEKGLKEIIEYSNTSISKPFDCIVNTEFLKEVAFMADYSYCRSFNLDIRMPLGEAGRFIKQFSKNNPDTIDYRLN